MAVPAVENKKRKVEEPTKKVPEPKSAPTEKVEGENFYSLLKINHDFFLGVSKDQEQHGRHQSPVLCRKLEDSDGVNTTSASSIVNN